MKTSLLLGLAICVAAPATAQTMPPPQDPIGGYAPSHPALPANIPPGATIVYQQAPSPDVAYPAPPPLAHYPVCKRGQYDKCIEPNSPK